MRYRPLVPYRNAASARGPDDAEAPDLGTDDLVVTSDAPSRERDPEPDAKRESAQIAVIFLGTIAMIGMLLTAR